MSRLAEPALRREEAHTRLRQSRRLRMLAIIREQRERRSIRLRRCYLAAADAAQIEVRP